MEHPDVRWCVHTALISLCYHLHYKAAWERSCAGASTVPSTCQQPLTPLNTPTPICLGPTRPTPSCRPASPHILQLPGGRGPAAAQAGVEVCVGGLQRAQGGAQARQVALRGRDGGVQLVPLALELLPLLGCLWGTQGGGWVGWGVETWNKGGVVSTGQGVQQQYRLAQAPGGARRVQW